MNAGATNKPVASDSGHVEVKNVNYRRKDRSISELESVASNPANDAVTRKIASDRILNRWHLIQSCTNAS